MDHPPISFRLFEWGAITVSVIVLFVFIGAIIVAWMTKDSSLPILLGMAGSNAGTAVGFWLGSSSGSQKKDSTLSAVLSQKQPTQ